MRRTLKDYQKQFGIKRIDADEILMEHGKYLEHCGCGYVHIWYLKLTDGFKQRVVDMLMEGKI